MAGDHPWMPFFVHDWLSDRDVGKMNRTARSFYFDMLCHEWIGGPLPDDMVEVAAILRELPRSLKPHWASIRARFEVGPNATLLHQKLETLRIRALMKSEKNSKSANTRWSSHANASQRREQLALLTESEQIQSRAEEETNTPVQARDEFDFESLYAKYPRKEGRKKGQQRFKSQITTRLKYDALTRAVENYAATITDTAYAKHFDTFMGCWEDYLDASVLAPKRTARASPTRNGPLPPMEPITESKTETLP